MSYQNRNSFHFDCSCVNSLAILFRLSVVNRRAESSRSEKRSLNLSVLSATSYVASQQNLACSSSSPVIHDFSVIITFQLVSTLNLKLRFLPLKVKLNFESVITWSRECFTVFFWDLRFWKSPDDVHVFVSSHISLRKTAATQTKIV